MLCVPRHDGEVPEPVHGDPASGVGAVYRRVRVRLDGGASMDASWPHANDPAGPADRALVSVAGIHALQLCGIEILAARRGDRDRVLNAILDRGIVGTA